MAGKKEFLYLLLRYTILILLALNGLWLFYFIFTPLTIYPVFGLLKLLFNASLFQDIISFNNYSIQLIPACIAGAAYYLLVILNLTTPMPHKKRIPAVVFSLLAFLIVNILRIFFFSLLLIGSFSLFNTIHLIFWYFLSSIIVFAIWLLEIKIFKINNIPVYTDLKFLYSKARKRK